MTMTTMTKTTRKSKKQKKTISMCRDLTHAHRVSQAHAHTIARKSIEKRNTQKYEKKMEKNSLTSHTQKSQLTKLL